MQYPKIRRIRCESVPSAMKPQSPTNSRNKMGPRPFTYYRSASSLPCLPLQGHVRDYSLGHYRTLYPMRFLAFD
ncbi:hypothetical protein M3J09_004096 [Ascochyta lentis]